MGCDIHLFVEAKTASGWHSVSHPNIDRWYSLFARLANVRNRGDIIPISDPRGLPDDVSEITKIVLAVDDNHSHSWVSMDEWETILNDERFNSQRILSSIIPWRIGDRECRDERILDCRLVFAFDN